MTQLLKQNWIKVVMGIAILVILFFIKGMGNSSSNTALISNAITPSPSSFTLTDEILSPNRNQTAFIKSYPENDVADKYGVYGHIAFNEIWIKDNNTGEEKLLVKSGDVSNYPFANSDNFPFSDIYNLNSPAFSLDGKRVYFLSFAWTTSNAVFSVDISTGKLHLISDGNSLEVIDMGPYKGNLKVSKHRYYDGPNYGSYDHYYVITDSGKEIKDLGE